MKFRNMLCTIALAAIFMAGPALAMTDTHTDDQFHALSADFGQANASQDVAGADTTAYVLSGYRGDLNSNLGYGSSEQAATAISERCSPANTVAAFMNASYLSRGADNSQRGASAHNSTAGSEHLGGLDFYAS